MDTKNFKQALEVLEDAKSQVKEILTGDEASSILLRITAGLNTGITALSHASGSANTAFATSTETKPITSFMGKKIGKPAAVVTEDQLSVSDHEKKVFIEKVESLYEAIEIMDSFEVLKNYTIPEDVLLIRAVAKKSGVADFETGELTVDFIEAIKVHKAIKDIEAAEKKKVLEGEFDEGEGLKDPIVVNNDIPQSKDETAQQRIDRINDAKTIDEVSQLIAGEDRKTVLEAAEKMIGKL